MRSLATLTLVAGLAAASAAGIDPVLDRGASATAPASGAGRGRSVTHTAAARPRDAESVATATLTGSRGDGTTDITDQLGPEECSFSSEGRNAYYMPLLPGERHDFEGHEGGRSVHLRVTVLNETKVVDRVETRVIEEYETADGKVSEVSRNYVAICRQTGSVFCFGEDVANYENGEIVDHEGSWRAGENGAEPGILMPGTVLVGSRYYQEIAPGIALDQAENVSTGETIVTPAGTFHDCLEVRETTQLEPDEIGFKYYAHGIGLVKDGGLTLVAINPTTAN